MSYRGHPRRSPPYRLYSTRPLTFPVYSPFLGQPPPAVIAASEEELRTRAGEGLPPSPEISSDPTAIFKRRGWVAIPSYDMREYVKQTFLTAALGFAMGVGIGAVLGNILKGKKVGDIKIPGVTI